MTLEIASLVSIERTYLFVASNEQGPVVSVRMDGGVEYGPGFTADEAAKVFWDALARITGEQWAKTLAAVALERAAVQP